MVALELWIGGFLTLFVAVFSTSVFSAELSHREIFWTTPLGGSLQVILMKLLAISSAAAIILLLGAGAAFLNPFVRNQLVLVGQEFLALYLVLAWVRIGLWAALSMFLFWFTRSRWLTVGLMGALHILWFVTVFIFDSTNMISLVHRGFLSWNFVDVFAPLGIIPGVFFLQGFVVIGIVIALMGASVWVKRSFPAWQGVGSASARRAFVLGIVVLSCAVGGIVYQIQKYRAPFIASEFFTEPARLEKLFIWSRDFNLLVYPGQYMALFLPSRVSLPPLIKEVAQTKEVRRYEDEELSIALVLLYPKATFYPPELERLIRTFLYRIGPLLDQAQVWLDNVPETVLVWPDEAFVFSREINASGNSLLVPRSVLLESVPAQRWEVAWALARASRLDKPACAYLSMFLISQISREEIESALDALESIASEEARIRWPYLPRGFYRAAHAPDGARRILRYWERGESVGHKTYIQQLLEGKQD